MDKIEEDIEEWFVPDNIKMPYAKHLGNGLYEVFDGTSTIYMGKELYERFLKLLQEAANNLNIDEQAP